MTATAEYAPDLMIERFAGPGGWDEGARRIGIEGIVGFDLDEAACRTARAAGHVRVRADVSRLRWGHLRGRVALLVDSPPCVAWSQAGKGAGRALAAEMEALLTDVCRGRRTVAAHRRRMARLLAASNPAWFGLPRAERAALAWREVRSATLVAEPARFVAEARPRRVALEQVPSVLPLWRLLAREWRAQGYSTWCGILSAEQWGVPQTRKRAILVASLDGPATPPTPTHHAYRKGEPRRGFEEDLFGGALRPWISMAEALGWTESAEVVSNYGTGGDPRNRGRRDGEEPSAAVTSKVGRNVVLRTGANSMVTGRTGTRAGDGDVQPYERDADAPAPTLDSKVGSAWRLHTNRGQEPDGTRQIIDPEEAPAPTVTGKSGGQWTYVNGNQPNAARRAADEPAPTVCFGHARNEVKWEPGDGACPECGCDLLVHDAGGFCAGLCGGACTDGGRRVPVEDQGDTRQVVQTSRGNPKVDPKNGDHCLDPTERPAHTVTGNTRDWVRRPERVNDQTGTAYDPDWPADRPATVIASRDLVQHPGSNANRFNGATKSRNDGYRVEVHEAAVLQSFQPDYPWQGTRTEVFRQIGDAVPPLLAAAVLGELLGIDWRARLWDAP